MEVGWSNHIMNTWINKCIGNAQMSPLLESPKNWLVPLVNSHKICSINVSNTDLLKWYSPIYVHVCLFRCMSPYTYIHIHTLSITSINQQFCSWIKISENFVVFLFLKKENCYQVLPSSTPIFELNGKMLQFENRNKPKLLGLSISICKSVSEEFAKEGTWKHRWK